VYSSTLSREVESVADLVTAYFGGLRMRSVVPILAPFFAKESSSLAFGQPRYRMTRFSAAAPFRAEQTISSQTYFQIRPDRIWLIKEHDTP
jgi:hypothetical protein